MQVKDYVKCLNCDQEFKGGDIFCSQCGQRKELSRINFKEILYEFLGSVFNWDSPFPRTLKALFSRPGKMITSFIKGERKKYYPPIRYMVVCLFISILVGELIGFDPIETQKEMNGYQGDNAAVNTGYEVGRFLSKNLNFFLFLLPFSIALFSKLFFWKKPYNMAERTVLGFYLAGQYTIVSIVPIILSEFQSQLILLVYLSNLAYIAYAIYHFHETNSKLVRGLKAFFVSLFSIVTYFIMSYIVALVLIKKFGMST
jgi:hypothetical protein